MDTFLGLKKRTEISSSMGAEQDGLDSDGEKLQFVTF
jgi:hypothetical protein